MCGITGILTPDLATARRAVAAMNQAQHHRGPDHVGEIFIKVGPLWLGLGNTRLAILDRSEAGHQPMVNPQTGDCLTFNGEIYNRRDLTPTGAALRSGSDTEVLLRWGHDRIEKLDGMFAYAFYRAADETLTLARDPAGIKPLYYARVNGHFIFASEIRALLASGLLDRSLDAASVAGFFAYGAVPEPRTIFQSVRALEPGTTLTLPGDRVERFWNFPDMRESVAPEEIRETLEREVRTHLDSDVPVGVFLSSGLDSTIIAGLAAKAGRVRTFTVGLDEASEARKTAELLQTDHHEVRLAPADVISWTRAWLRHMDQPTIDGLNTYIVSRAARHAGITVALSGLGGDELFGGYPTFRDVPQICSRLGLVPRSLRKTAAWVASVGRPTQIREKALDMSETGGTLPQIYLHRRRVMSNRQMSDLALETPEVSLPATIEDDPVASVARFEFSTYLRNMLLRDSDDASMANSIELRVPMLSRSMLDLAYSIPGDRLLPAGAPSKHVERTAFADLLREPLLNQPKRGFTLPIGEWMLGPLKEEARAGCETLKRTGVVRPMGVDRIWKAFVNEPKSPVWSRAWALVVLGNYLGRAK